MTTPTGPVYFFDQPTRHKRKIRGRRRNLELGSDEDKDQSDGLEGQPGEAHEEEEDTPEISSAVFSQDQDVMGAYMRTAPRLLSELAHVLSQHKWSAEGQAPHGLVNILNYTWQELTAGARLLTSSQHTGKRCKAQGSSDTDLDFSPRPLSAKQKTEREAVACQVQPQVSANNRVKKRRSRSWKDLSTTSISFSISNQTTKEEWITQNHKLSCSEDIQLYKWALDRLHAARSPLEAETNLNRPLLLRHYGDAQATPRNRSEMTEARPSALFNGLPRIPDMKQLDPLRQKLHYRINDGSSFIYYSSGYMAVCQSYSTLPCGGFYTTVFMDSPCPVVIATITAFGHASLMHPGSCAISALWNQKGGRLFDHKGSVIEEWNWSLGLTKKKIVIQVSDKICLDLFSGTYTILNFRCDNEHVQLPFSALSLSNTTNKMPYLQTDITFASDTAYGLSCAQSPVICTDNIDMTHTHIVKEVDCLDEASSLWSREGRASRELKRIQQRVQCTLDAWMDFYCMAVGIKCPDMQRMPDVSPRSRLKREVQSSVLPALNSPEQTDAGPVPLQDEEVRPRRLSAPARRRQDPAPTISRPLKKQTKEDCSVKWIGPLQLNDNVNPESVILPEDPDQQPTCFSHPIPFIPFAPVTHCPVLLRAALIGDVPFKRCCCSPLMMPVVTDLEYDIFIMGQPQNSHQMLIVCVSCQNLYPYNASGRDPLEQLYRRKNKHRTMPCTQCHLDSFRLVKYAISIPKPCFEAQKELLQQRHNAAHGMVLMYIKGKLLFVGYVTPSDRSCPVKDIEKQISKARGDYRLGLYLPSDFKFIDKVETAVAKDTSIDPLPGDEHKKTSCSGEEIINCTVKGSEVKLQQKEKNSHRKQKKTVTKLAHRSVIGK